jgi:hypothetical protein
LQGLDDARQTLEVGAAALSRAGDDLIALGIQGNAIRRLAARRAGVTERFLNLRDMPM